MVAKVLLLATVLGMALAALAAAVLWSSDTFRSLALDGLSWWMIGGGAASIAAGLRLAMAPTPRRVGAFVVG